MKSQIRDTLIAVCTAGTIAITVSPITTEPPPGWSQPLRQAGTVLAIAGMATILTKED